MKIPSSRYYVAVLNFTFNALLSISSDVNNFEIRRRKYKLYWNAFIILLSAHV